jgi:ABC-2 type transport system ATP-binding protein
VTDGGGEPVLVLRADRLRAARRVLVARQVAVSAEAGDVVAVEGANGSGKSTLLAAAAGVLPTGQAGRRPASVGYAPERADVLPRLTVWRWLTGLARTAGLSRAEATGQAAEVLARVGLAGAGHQPLRELSRGNVQRALVAQALVGPPELVVLDEPSGGLDRDGLGRVTTEIRRVAGRSSVVLVARHPTAPLSLPAGPAWRIGDGAVRTEDRVGDAVPVLEVETGDGEVREVSEPELAAVLREALDAGLAIRRVQPVEPAAPPGQAASAASPAADPRADLAADLAHDHAVGGAPTADPGAGLTAGSAAGAAPAAADAPPSSVPRPVARASGPSRVFHGAVHRARLLAVSQWFAAPALLFLIVLGIFYANPVGPLLPAAGFIAAVLAAIMIWVSVLAHLADGRLMARAFAAHVGGNGRAHLAACLATVPFAVAATVIAVGWSAFSQPLPRHHFPGLLLDMITLDLAAAAFGVAVGALLVPPLVDRAGWRICLATGLLVALLLVPVSPMRPLLLLVTHPGGSVAAAAGLLAATAAAVIGLTTATASRLP